MFSVYLIVFFCLFNWSKYTFSLSLSTPAKTSFSITSDGSSCVRTLVSILLSIWVEPIGVITMFVCCVRLRDFFV